MFKVIFWIKKRKYEMPFEKGQDFLFFLDKFLKKNKINKGDIKGFKFISPFKKESISEKVIQTILETIRLSQKFSKID